tara:strand:+ start:686 stop:937 length:252 start_codon:yes stop_codon:yes gene_type:complete
MQIQNSQLFQRLNTSEWELIFYILNVMFPGPTVVTSENIVFYKLESLKFKLMKTKNAIKDEYSHMYYSIYEKLELDKIQEKEF